MCCKGSVEGGKVHVTRWLAVDLPPSITPERLIGHFSSLQQGMASLLCLRAAHAAISTSRRLLLSLPATHDHWSLRLHECLLPG